MKRITIILQIIFLVAFAFLLDKSIYAQGSISLQCKNFNLNRAFYLKCDNINEDDPNVLTECYSHLVTYISNGSTDQRFEMRFPARVTSYHWSQASSDDKNDSLSAELMYEVNSENDKTSLDAYPKDFTITVTRYDDKKGGIIEGKFNCTMKALNSDQQPVPISVHENFKTTRTGKPDDECRDQTNAEKKVITNAVSIFENTFLQPLQKMNWQITEEENGKNAQIAINPAPYRPMFLCSDFFDLKLNINPDSPLGKMMQDSAEYYNNLVSQYSSQIGQPSYDKSKLSQATRNMYRVQEAGRAEISINANDPYLKQDWLLDSKDRHTVLHIPGVAYAWQLYELPTDDLQSPVEKTMLYFGNWTGINMFTGTYAGYPFIHKQQSPYIENFVVTIIAQTAVANEIIKKIDWSKLNEAIKKINTK